jgi:hypothetical protein
MKTRLILTALLIVAVSPAVNLSASLHGTRIRAVAFDVIPPCPVPADAVAFSDLTKVPSALRDALKTRLGELVSPKARFDATDVVITGHNRRLIFVWSRTGKWVVATEHGGLGYNDPILAYAVSPDGQQATLLAERVAYPKSVCSTAEQLLAQQTGAN